MSITFYPYRKEGDCWDIARNSFDFPNLANGNAADVLDELGFGREAMWDADPVSIDLFEQACVLARAGFDGKPVAAVPDKVDRGNGPTIIHCGRREGRMNEYMEALLDMVRHGRAGGATHIGWG